MSYLKGCRQGDGSNGNRSIKDNELLVAAALATGKSISDLVGHPAMQELIKETCSQVLRDEMARGCFNEEDLAQEVSLKVWLYGKDFRRDSYVRTWVRKIASNACVDLIRKYVRDNTCSLEEGEIVERIDRLGSSNENQARKVSLKEAIDQLSDTERELLRLSVMGWKLCDFESRLGIPKSVASRRLRQIQKKLIGSIVGFEIFRTRGPMPNL